MRKKHSLASYQTVFCVGDIHGAIADLCDEIVAKKLSNSLVIVVGDIGIGLRPFMTEDMELSYLQDTVAKMNTAVCFIRGNHDNPSYFHDLEHASKRWFDYLRNVHFVDDYDLIETKVGNFLAIGGARSIDRIVKTEQSKLDENSGWNRWFTNEMVEHCDDETEDWICSQKINYIVSHTAPIYAKPELVFNREMEEFTKSDKTLKSDVKAEREYLADLGDVIGASSWIRKWIYGHFHMHKSEMISGTHYVCLDRMRVNKTTHQCDFDFFEVHPEKEVKLEDIKSSGD